MKYRTGLGQDSHRFLPEGSSKPCILAGLIFPGMAMLFFMRSKISGLMELQLHEVGLTSTASDGLTEFGLGEGIQCIRIITMIET